MLYPLSYECEGASRRFGPVGFAWTTLHEGAREVKSIRAGRADLGRRGKGGAPPWVVVEGGAREEVAEAEGFEPSMDGKAQTALAVRRHRPD
jgi:hypothetical protein